MIKVKPKSTQIKYHLSGKEINLTSDNTTIKSNNFNVDKYGNVVANSLTSNNASITGGKINLSGYRPELSIEGNDLFDTSSRNYIMSDGMRVQNNSYGFNTIYIANSNTSEGFSGSIKVRNSSNNSVSMDGAGILVTSGTGTQTTIKPNEVRSPKITQTSLEKYKKNFEKLENAITIIKNTDIYKYNLKTEEDKTKKHIGFIIGSNYNYAKEITSEKNDGVDLYSMISVAYKAIQEQQEQIELLQEEINKLKGEK